MPEKIPELEQPMSPTDINEAIKFRASLEKFPSSEAEGRAEEIVGRAAEFVRLNFPPGPNHPLWGEGGRWNEVRDTHVNQIAAVYHLVLPPMRQAAKSHGKRFPPNEIVNCALEHVAIAGISRFAEEIHGGQEQPRTLLLPGWAANKNVPPDYGQKVQILSKLIASLLLDWEKVHDSNQVDAGMAAFECLIPGRLTDGTSHEGLVNTLGNTLNQLEQLMPPGTA